jgi:hypothetical protein
LSRILTWAFCAIVLVGFDQTPAAAFQPLSLLPAQVCIPSAFATAIDCGESIPGFSVPDPRPPSSPSVAVKPSPALADSVPAAPPPNPLPVLEPEGANGACLTETTDPAATTPAQVAYLNRLMKNLLVDFAACPPPVAGPAAPAVLPDPAALAEQFWQTIPLPSPRPSIPPGYAITGKPAYLVTDGTVAPAPFTEPTPLGLLTVTPHGTYHVVWGDGASTGPFDAKQHRLADRPDRSHL